jgi:hypothetical protein
MPSSKPAGVRIPAPLTKNRPFLTKTYLAPGQRVSLFAVEIRTSTGIHCSQRDICFIAGIYYTFSPSRPWRYMDVELFGIDIKAG